MSLLQRRAIHLATQWAIIWPQLDRPALRELVSKWYLWTYNYIPSPDYLDEIMDNVW